MNFKQEHDGLINVSFMPNELLTLVRMVKSSEQMRIESLRVLAKENLKISTVAEKEDLPE